MSSLCVHADVCLRIYMSAYNDAAAPCGAVQRRDTLQPVTPDLRRVRVSVTGSVLPPLANLSTRVASRGHAAGPSSPASCSLASGSMASTSSPSQPLSVRRGPRACCPPPNIGSLACALPAPLQPACSSTTVPRSPTLPHSTRRRRRRRLLENSTCLRVRRATRWVTAGTIGRPLYSPKLSDLPPATRYKGRCSQTKH